MKKLPEIGSVVVANDTQDAVFWRVVDHFGKIGVYVIDVSIEDKVPNQAVQYLDVDQVWYPSIKQFKHFTFRKIK